jgi:phosphomevalonate kinase
MKTNNRKLIVFSGKQFSGKDTVAKILLAKFPNFKRIGIADAIKIKFSEVTGLSLEEIEKNKSIYRQDLINLGDWGRAQNPDFWLNSILEYKGDTIVTDIRVKHELDVFRSVGAFCIRVEANEEIRATRGKLTSKNDSTETDLDNIKDWDYIIYNNGTYENLTNSIEDLVEVLGERL